MSDQTEASEVDEGPGGSGYPVAGPGGESGGPGGGPGAQGGHPRLEAPSSKRCGLALGSKSIFAANSCG